MIGNNNELPALFGHINFDHDIQNSSALQSADAPLMDSWEKRIPKAADLQRWVGTILACHVGAEVQEEGGQSQHRGA